MGHAPERLLRLLSGCLHIPVLGNLGSLRLEVEGRGCMDQAHTVPAWASEQAAVCAEGPRLVTLEPPGSLHGLHKNKPGMQVPPGSQFLKSVKWGCDRNKAAPAPGQPALTQGRLGESQDKLSLLGEP